MDFNARNFDSDLYIDYPLITDILDLFLQEIDLILYTENGSVMCYRNFGFNLEALLWNTTINRGSIENLIKEQITENCLSNVYFNWSVKFSIIKGQNRDIGVVDVIIKNKETLDTLSNKKYIFK